ncbi:unnamed protein product [Heligmosomoides polygyrus]|uniref:Uncharacterized protein n=1 Tax=Heligmosomoides polygyrus TaxID=6339 RepID=A0A3P8A955_HELPZ|nr:unnamed protein product [Heligmosomoides polygyrus]
MEDELMEFSGDMPDPSQPLLQDGILSNDDFMNSTMVQVSAATTTIGALFTTKPIVYRLITHVPAPFLPYTPNFYRIAALSVRCLLALLVLVLSGTIKRDFLKIFTLLLLLPIVLDCGFDVYTEIKTSVSYYGSREIVLNLTDSFVYLDYLKHHDRIGALQHEGIKLYQALLTKHTSYMIFSNETQFALVSFILSDILFWSTLFSSVVAFYYAHKAIVRDGKWRLFSFILFQIVIHVLTVPYLIWAGVSLAQDFLFVFNFSEDEQKRLPLNFAAGMYEDHHIAFMIRPLLILVSIVIFIAPYRKKFIRFFCPCCRRD